MVADILQFSPAAEEINRNTTDAEWLGVVEALTQFTGLSGPQTFTCQRRREIHHPTLKLDAREYLVQDAHTNLFTVFAADLIDGERHLVPTRVGSHTRGLRRRWNIYGVFDDDMLHHLQDEAWVLFGRQTVAILRARQAANVPSLINTTASPGETGTPAQEVVATTLPVIKPPDTVPDIVLKA